MSSGASTRQFAILVSTALVVIVGATLALGLLGKGRGDLLGGASPSTGGPGGKHAPEDHLVDLSAGPPPSRQTPTPKPAGADEPAGTLLRGRVVDADGEPVIDHRIVLALPLGGSDVLPNAGALLTLSANPEIHGWPVAMSGPDGGFEIRTTRRGPAVVLAGPPDHEEYSLEITLSGAPVDLEVRLRAGLGLSGRVSDRSTTAGVSGVLVTAVQPGAGSKSRQRRTETGPDGSFTLGGFDPGKVKLMIDTPGRKDLDPGWSRTVWVRAGEVDVQLWVNSVGFAEFRATTSPGGNPYAGRVSALVLSDREAQALVYPEKPGTYLLRGPAGNHEYALSSEGFAPVILRITIEQGARKVLGGPVEFKPGAPLFGTLELPDDPGQDVDIPRSAGVYVESLDPSLGRIRMKGVKLRTRTYGEFRFEGLPLGLHRVVAAARGYGIFETTVTVTADGAPVRILLPGQGTVLPAVRGPFAERRGIRIDLEIDDLTAPEAIALLAAVSDTSLTLAPGVDVGEKTYNIHMGSTRLDDAVRRIEIMWKLDFDTSTGIFGK